MKIQEYLELYCILIVCEHRERVFGEVMAYCHNTYLLTDLEGFQYDLLSISL